MKPLQKESIRPNHREHQSSNSNKMIGALREEYMKHGLFSVLGMHGEYKYHPTELRVSQVLLINSIKRLRRSSYQFSPISFILQQQRKPFICPSKNQKQHSYQIQVDGPKDHRPDSNEHSYKNPQQNQIHQYTRRQHRQV